MADMQYYKKLTSYYGNCLFCVPFGYYQELIDIVCLYQAYLGKARNHASLNRNKDMIHYISCKCLKIPNEKTDRFIYVKALAV